MTLSEEAHWRQVTPERVPLGCLGKHASLKQYKLDGSDVRYWPLADMDCCAANVRFRGQSGHAFLRRECSLLTQSGHSV
jgi:hypothetical protein